LVRVCDVASSLARLDLLERLAASEFASTGADSIGAKATLGEVVVSTLAQMAAGVVAMFVTQWGDSVGGVGSGVRVRGVAVTPARAPVARCCGAVVR
jgi:hypothetical protein